MFAVQFDCLPQRTRTDRGGLMLRIGLMFLGFWPPSATVVSAEPFLHGTGTLRCLQKEMATQTLNCVLVARPKRCPTLSNPVPWQNWMAAYLSYTLQMKMLFRGWLIMVNDTHTRRRRSVKKQKAALMTYIYAWQAAGVCLPFITYSHLSCPGHGITGTADLVHQWHIRLYI